MEESKKEALLDNETVDKLLNRILDLEASIIRSKVDYNISLDGKNKKISELQESIYYTEKALAYRNEALIETQKELKRITWWRDLCVVFTIIFAGLSIYLLWIK